MRRQYVLGAHIVLWCALENTHMLLSSLLFCYKPAEWELSSSSIMLPLFSWTICAHVDEVFFFIESLSMTSHSVRYLKFSVYVLLFLRVIKIWFSGVKTQRFSYTRGICGFKMLSIDTFNNLTKNCMLYLRSICKLCKFLQSLPPKFVFLFHRVKACLYSIALL